MTTAPDRPLARHRLRPLGGLAILALTMAACTPSEHVGPNPDLGWLPASSPKTLEVDRAEYRHAVYFATDRAEITANERDRLLTFLRTIQVRDRDSLHLEGHADERATEVYNLELAARRNASVEGFLAELGVGNLVRATAAYGERAPASPGTGPDAWRQNRRVELVLERHLVTLPACPDWSRRSGLDFDNLPLSNYGCATQTNLGLMIADPRDLVRGRGLGSADGIHQAEGIVRYREGEVVELQEERVEN
jgi:pilus assembly protein CpaD